MTRRSLAPPPPPLPLRPLCVLGTPVVPSTSIARSPRRVGPNGAARCRGTPARHRAFVISTRASSKIPQARAHRHGHVCHGLGTCWGANSTPPPPTLLVLVLLLGTHLGGRHPQLCWAPHRAIRARARSSPSRTDGGANSVKPQLSRDMEPRQGSNVRLQFPTRGPHCMGCPHPARRADADRSQPSERTFSDLGKRTPPGAEGFVWRRGFC